MAEELTNRQRAKRNKRAAGDQSAYVAKRLMELGASAITKLDLDEDLLKHVHAARKITANVARRREQRSLAGSLRSYDLGEMVRKIENIEATGNADSRLQHLAEEWRTRLLGEGSAAVAELIKIWPHFEQKQVEQALHNAVKEQQFGKPAGAKRALFRVLAAGFGPQETAENATEASPQDDE